MFGKHLVRAWTKPGTSSCHDGRGTEETIYYDAIWRVARPCGNKVDVYPSRRRPAPRTMRSIARRCDSQNTNLKFESVETKPNCLYYNPRRPATSARALLVCFLATLLRRFRASSPHPSAGKGTELRAENQNWHCTRNFSWYVLVQADIQLFAHTECLIRWYGTKAVPDRPGLGCTGELNETWRRGELHSFSDSRMSLKPSSRRKKLLCVAFLALIARTCITLRFGVTIEGDEDVHGWFTYLPPKTQNPRRCVVCPTFPGHFHLANRLFISAGAYARDHIDFYFIVDDSKQVSGLVELLSNSRNESEYIDQRSNFNLEQVQILSLMQILDDLQQPYGHGAALPIPENLNSWIGPRVVRTRKGFLPRTFNVKRRYQMLKKLAAMVYLTENQRCDEFWVIDSESFPFRPFSFADIFTRVRAENDLDLKRDMAACVNKFSNTKFSHLTLKSTNKTCAATCTRLRGLQMFFGLTDTYFAHAYSECDPLRIAAYDDRWFYDARKVQHMYDYLSRLHYPRSFTNLILTWEGANNGDNYVLSAWELLHAYDRRSDPAYRLRFSDVAQEIKAKLPTHADAMQKADMQYEHRYGYSWSTSMLTAIQTAEKSSRLAMSGILNHYNYTTCRGWNPPCFEILRPLFPAWNVSWCLSNCDAQSYWREICEPDPALAKHVGACQIDIR